MTTSPPRLGAGPEPPGSAAGPPKTGSKVRDAFSYWGWRVAVAGALSQMLIAGMIQHAYTHYSVLLREEFGWSATVIFYFNDLRRWRSCFSSSSNS